MLKYLLLLIVTLSSSSADFADDIDNKLDFLADKIEKLEHDYKDEIATLKKQIKKINNKFEAERDKLLKQIYTLKEEQSNIRNNKEDDEHKKTPVLDAGSTQTVSRTYADLVQVIREKKTLPARRSVVDTEVAFYATQTSHDNPHLGDNQILVFDNVITNVGNAYSSHHGGFVAPVDGTYVIHGTMMGVSSSTSQYCAYIDVDGVQLSTFWVSSYDQSSHMLIKELKAGQTVTIKNCRVNDMFIGQHFSAFSGFLLYQHSGEQVIVGK